jgi:hypothetical protein
MSGIIQWKQKPESAAFTRYAFQFYCSAVRIHNMTDKRKTESAAFDIVRQSR